MRAQDDALFSGVTKSGITTTRVSTLLAQSEMMAGFGADVSFTTLDARGAETTIGTLAMQHLGDGTGAGDYVVRLSNGATKNQTDSKPSLYDRFRVRSAGGVEATSNYFSVINGIRRQESTNAAEEQQFSRVTMSSLTATRASTLYKQSERAGRSC